MAMHMILLSGAILALSVNGKRIEKREAELAAAEAEKARLEAIPAGFLQGSSLEISFDLQRSQEAPSLDDTLIALNAGGQLHECMRVWWLLDPRLPSEVSAWIRLHEGTGTLVVENFNALEFRVESCFTDLLSAFTWPTLDGEVPLTLSQAE